VNLLIKPIPIKSRTVSVTRFVALGATGWRRR
jgi:hypothetical protein